MKQTRRNIVRGWGSLLLTVIMLFTMSMSAFAYDNGDRVSYTSRDDRGYISHFTVQHSGGNYQGTCMQAGNMRANSGTATVTKLSNNTKMAKIIYYYGYVYEGGWWEGSHRYDNAKSFLGMQNDTVTVKKYLIESFAQMGNQGVNNWKNISYGIPEILDEYVDKVSAFYENFDASSVTVPDSFEIYKCTESGGSQDFVIWRLNPTGKLKLKKTSALPLITN